MGNNKIKAVLFDLDGVLVDARDWHKDSFNFALEYLGYQPLSENEHLNEFDGLPTYKKISKLLTNNRIDQKNIEAIKQLKQEKTVEYAKKNSVPNKNLQELLEKLKADGLKIACCSNSISDTVNLFLKLSGIDTYFDFILSNNDVNEPKPSPEIYIKAMNILNLTPEEVLICEDSPVGLESAEASKANVFFVKNPSEVNLINIEKEIRKLNESI